MTGYINCHFVEIENNTCVGVLCFGSQISKCESELYLSDFQEVIRHQARDFHYTWDIGVGGLHKGLLLIRTSYLEARENLNRMKYLNQSTREPMETQTSNSIDIEYGLSRTRQMIGFALEGNIDGFESALLVLEEIALCQGNSGDIILAHFQEIKNLIVSELMKYHMDLSKRSYILPPLTDCSGDTLQMLQKMQTFCRDAYQMFYGAGRRGRNKYVDSAKKYIAEHYSSSTLSLDEASAYVGITSPYFSRIFAESVGQGFLDYLNQFRTEKARQLLLSTDMPIADVGYRVGFSSSQSFTRVFKKVMKMPPSQYRDSIRSLVVRRG